MYLPSVIYAALIKMLQHNASQGEIIAIKSEKYRKDQAHNFIRKKMWFAH